MKRIFGAVMIMLSLNAWGGGEVPWPADQQEDLLVRYLDGMWMNSSTTHKMIYYIEAEATKAKDCPYLVHVIELNGTGKMMFAGSEKVCRKEQSMIGVILYDSLGRAKKYVDFVGVSSGKKQQNIGLSVYDYNAATIKGNRIEQDVFVKVAKVFHSYP